MASLGRGEDYYSLHSQPCARVEMHNIRVLDRDDWKRTQSMQLFADASSQLSSSDGYPITGEYETQTSVQAKRLNGAG